MKNAKFYEVDFTTVNGQKMICQSVLAENEFTSLINGKKNIQFYWDNILYTIEL